ncbi:hypothetical protein ACIQTT_00830 [Microbacterium sp. NPDC090225]|uniref:hypothetical protein n=1 Tax=Microbacterium sp. NPDC090225 TaxID=3364207 RepID=UPI00382E6EC6
MNDREQHSADVLWACVEDGFHVGSRGGDFLGYVDRQTDGRYVAFDARSHELGSHASLAEATDAVTASSTRTPLATAGDELVGGDR